MELEFFSPCSCTSEGEMNPVIELRGYAKKGEEMSVVGRGSRRARGNVDRASVAGTWSLGSLGCAVGFIWKSP